MKRISKLVQGLITVLPTVVTLYILFWLGSDDRVVVYLPMSYQMGGYMAIVPANKIRPIDMSTEEAMPFVLTAGLSTPPAEE